MSCLTGRPAVLWMLLVSLLLCLTAFFETSRFADGVSTVGELHYAARVTVAGSEAENERNRHASPSPSLVVESAPVSMAPIPRPVAHDLGDLPDTVPSGELGESHEGADRQAADTEAVTAKEPAAAVETAAGKARNREGDQSVNKAEEQQATSEPDVDDYKSCLDLVRKFPEDRSIKYSTRQTIDLAGPVYAFYQWDRPIHKQDLDIQKGIVHGEDCRVVLKVKDGSLFVYQHSRCYEVVYSEEDSAPKRRFEKAVELILLALDLFVVPDVDFVIELEDSDRVPEKYSGTLPVLCYSLRANSTRGQGFTFPSFGAYDQALGLTQLEWHKVCLDTRYPRNKRIQKGVWRGTTTGGSLKTTTDVYENRRVALAQLGVQEPDIMEAGIVGYLQVHTDDPEVTAELERLAPIRGWIRFEDFNAFRAVIDVDGNAWSDRFFRLLAFNTPILKQEYSHWREYFSHLVEEAQLVTFFKEDLSDLADKIEDILYADASYQAQLDDKVERSFEFVAEHLSLPGVIRAMAYSMFKYASFLTWTVEMEEGYVEIPKTSCCQHNPSIPKQIVNRMRS